MKWILLIFAIGLLIWWILPTIYMIQGNKAYGNGGTKDALRWYEKAQKTGHVSVSCRITYALLLLRDGRPEEAERLLNQIIRDKSIKENKKGNARIYRCMAYTKENRIEDAYEDAMELLEKGKSTTLYAMAGYVMLLSGKPDAEILDFCEEAYDYNPDERDITDNLAAACIKTGDYERAKELGEELMEHYPKFVEGFYHTACAYYALGDYEKAKTCMEGLENCQRHYLTTVSEQEIEELKACLKEKLA